MHIRDRHTQKTQPPHAVKSPVVQLNPEKVDADLNYFRKS
jgi:hypothetical protein